MLQQLLQTDSGFVNLFLRVVAGVIILPYGAQKLLGWFEDMGGGVGIRQTLLQMKAKKIPAAIAWLVIIGQFFGSIGLILGCFGRVAALANFVIFSGALIMHAADGWTLNWLGKKKGEGIEYFVLLLSILLVIIIGGSGPFSVDAWIISTFCNH